MPRRDRFSRSPCGACNVPAVGRERNGDHEHRRPFGELDADDVELPWIKRRGARRLRENDDGRAFGEPLCAAFEEGLQVDTGFGAPHGDGARLPPAFAFAFASWTFTLGRNASVTGQLQRLVRCPISPATDPLPSEVSSLLVPDKSQ